jgi:hypothetical protein
MAININYIVKDNMQWWPKVYIVKVHQQTSKWSNIGLENMTETIYEGARQSVWGKLRSHALIRANDKNFIIQHVQYFIYTYKLWLC